MKRHHSFLKTCLSGANLSLIVSLNGIFLLSAQAQFTSPPGQGRPTSTAGGGTRPAQPFCLQQSTRQPIANHANLIAMSPTKFVGLTTETSPTVWVYVPATIAATLEFSLYTEHQDGIYQTTIPVKPPGLVKISLPTTEVNLQPGQSYRWTAVLVCDPTERSKDWSVEGWIQHQPLPIALQRQLSQATANQKVQLYMQAGFWYEALNTYLTLPPRSRAADLAVLWVDLLNMAGLEAIAIPF